MSHKHNRPAPPVEQRFPDISTEATPADPEPIEVGPDETKAPEDPIEVAPGEPVVEEPIVETEEVVEVETEQPTETAEVEAEPVVEGVESEEAESVEYQPEVSPYDQPEADPEADSAAEPEEGEHEFFVSDVPTGKPRVTDEDVKRVALEVISGQWGRGDDREIRLTESGYDYSAVQDLVNEMLDPGSAVHRTYSIQPGDTLKGIARRIGYKGTGDWFALYQRNRGILGSDPNAMPAPGTVISL